MKGIYKFSVNFGRAGVLTGIFVADSTDIETAVGKTVDFGECLGKHSEVIFDFDMDCVELCSSDPVVIKMFEEHDLDCGYNPVLNIKEREEEYNDEEDA